MIININYIINKVLKVSTTTRTKTMNSYSEEQLLSMLFLTRTQKLLSKIAKDYSMDEEELKRKYINEIQDLRQEQQPDAEKEVQAPKDNNSEVKKRGRGRPKGSTKKKNDLEKFKLEETAIEKFIVNYLKGNHNNIKIEKVQKSMEKSLSVTADNYQVDTFKEIFNKIIQQQKEEEEKEEGNVEEEISCVEMEYEGKTYLLDKSSMKVYQRESPNDFVGKLEGDIINFEAIDSDIEEDE